MKEKACLKLDMAILMVLGILCLSSCVSEALSRNCTRVIIVLGVIRCVLEPTVLYRLKEIKLLLIGIALFYGDMLFSAIYGGRFWELTTVNYFALQYNALLVPFCYIALRSRERIQKLLYGVFTSMVVTDLYIMKQTMEGVLRPDALLALGVITGTCLCAIMLPAMTAISFNKYSSKAGRIYMIVCAVFTAAALICENTRGGWLAIFPVVMMVILYNMPSWKQKLAACMVILMLGGATLVSFPSVLQRADTIVHNQAEQSVNERYLMWQSAWAAWQDRPILGTGLENYAELYRSHYISPLAKERHQGHAHNTYMQVLAESGAVGLATLCTMLLSVLIFGWKNRKSVFGVAIMASGMAFILYGITDHTIINYGSLRVLWLMVGCCAAYIKLDNLG